MERLFRVACRREADDEGNTFFDGKTYELVDVADGMSLRTLQMV